MNPIDSITGEPKHSLRNVARARFGAVRGSKMGQMGQMGQMGAEKGPDFWEWRRFEIYQN